MSPEQLQQLSTIMRLFGGLPRTYVAIDSETTGYDLRDDLIWNWSFTTVTDGRITQEESYVLNWLHKDVAEIIDQEWLTGKIERQRYGMSQKNRQTKLSLAALRQGQHPLTAMQHIADRLLAIKAEGMPLVGHGIIRFDIPRVAFQLREWLQVRWSCDRAKAFDAGAVEKAIVTGMSPQRGESFFQFSTRVLHAFSRGKWNLDDHCAAKYELYKRAELRPEDAHDATADCRLCKHLLDAWYELLSTTPEAVHVGG